MLVWQCTLTGCLCGRHFDDARSKDQTKNLGHLYALLSVSKRYTWHDMQPVILEESLNRAVLWVCKKSPGLLSALSILISHSVWPSLQVLISMFASLACLSISISSFP